LITITSCQILGEPLPAPTDVTVIALSSRSIRISWLPVAGAEGYNVRRCDSESGSFSLMNAVVVIDSKYDDTGLTANTVYWYKVVALKGGTEQELSNPVSGTTSPPPSAEYVFNGNANDTSGNGHDGIVHGATLTSDRFGNTNSAYSFDGVDDFIEIPLSFDSGVNCFSFHTFVLLDVVGEHIDVFHLGNNGGEISLAYTDADMAMRFGVKLSDGWYDTLQEVMESGRWYSIAGVYMKGSKLKLYVDGVLIEEQDVPNLFMFIYPPLKSTIGCTDYGFKVFHWQGKIDDCRFYSHALTDIEIGYLFHEGGWTGD
jgi:hypothetical protein